MIKFFLIGFVLLSSASTYSVEYSPKGLITSYNTGWGGDIVRVTIEGADYSEIAECSTKDGYVTQESSGTGYKTHNAALLSAYISKTPVKLVLDGCSSNRPRIYGVYM